MSMFFSFSFLVHMYIFQKGRAGGNHGEISWRIFFCFFFLFLLLSFPTQSYCPVVGFVLFISAEASLFEKRFCASFFLL